MVFPGTMVSLTISILSSTNRLQYGRKMMNVKGMKGVLNHTGKTTSKLFYWPMQPLIFKLD